MSLKSFHQVPILSWDIRYATFQPAKFVSSFQKLLVTSIQILDIWWSSLDIMGDLSWLSELWFVYFMKRKTTILKMSWKSSIMSELKLPTILPTANKFGRLHSCCLMYWPGPFNYFQKIYFQGFMVLKHVNSYK